MSKVTIEIEEEYLLTLAGKESIIEESPSFSMDAFGGNMDNAYYRGCDDGETILARELLKYVVGKE